MGSIQGASFTVRVAAGLLGDLRPLDSAVVQLADLSDVTWGNKNGGAGAVYFECRNDANCLSGDSSYEFNVEMSQAAAAIAHDLRSLLGESCVR